MNNSLRLLLVEDESFTRQLVANALIQQGFTVRDCSSVSEALNLAEEFEPHVVISDLDLGAPGASGVDLLQHLHRAFPWIGLVALTAHKNPALAAAGSLPASVTYLVKSEIQDLGQIGASIRATLSQGGAEPAAGKHLNGDEDEIFEVSREQAQALRMLAQGMTNRAIADSRGTTLRAVETLISRTYLSLGLHKQAGRNYRIEAVRLWQSGRVRVV